VTDTGTGMTPEVVSKACEPFFTTKPMGVGTGLGLSMVYGFVKQSMGHVKIDSQVGVGTRIKIYLPSVDISNSAQAVSVQHQDQPAPRGSEKILYVEDNPGVRDRVAAQLKSLGYRVVVAANGADAIKELETNSDFDLLFTDVLMPGGMNGRQLAEASKKRFPSLSVLFTSGFTKNVFGNSELNSGIQFLAKPFRRNEMAQKIRKALNSSKRDAQIS
jgi:CheY-like chemotaxis protein